MTAQQYTEQLITEARTQLDTAQRARLVATGGADLGLMAALEFWGDDLVRAGETRDPQTWGRALTALRTLTARQ